MARRRARKGQSEVIGGLIVLTLLFAMIVPMLISTYSSTVQMTTSVKQSIQQEKTAFNEKIEIKPLDPNNEAFIRAGWIPGVFINNTGTVSVTLTKLFLINKLNNSIFRVYDLRYARPGITPDIKVMLVDVDLVGGGHPPPPAGSPIILEPGENLLVVFNETILPFAPHLVVLAESAKGVIHPIVSSSRAQTLYPGRPGQGGGGGAGPGAWRGIFAPQSGFSLQGGEELARAGTAYAWRPYLHVYPADRYWRPTDFDYYHSFIYDDPDYPGLYMLDIQTRDNIRLVVNGGSLWLYSGYRIVIKGYVGTYDAGGGGYGTYFNGYATEIYVYSYWGNLVAHFGPYDPTDLGANGITITDFDGNGINELTFYSYLNGPNYPDWMRTNPDTDDDGSSLRDTNLWTYMVARDLSNVDYVKVTVKINYYWTTTFVPGYCPDWDTRDLKIFSIVAWRYDEDTDEWVIYQHRDYYYRSDKPVQFQVTAVFPLSRSGTYRVGVLFYDNYRDWDMLRGGGTTCHTDFTMTLEHMIVEYGILNPLFRESPPLYIIAIPEPSLISGIGEKDFMNAYNLTDINDAKVRAQQLLLTKLEEELNYAGISGYTVLTSPDEACELLFGALPPKYAIIIWLQGGNISVPSVLPCVDDDTVFNMIRSYHWVWVWPMETPFAGRYAVYNDQLQLLPYGAYKANITDVGLQIRIKAYAFYLFNSVPFVHLAYPYSSDLLIINGTLYANTTTTPTYYGTSAYWVSNGWRGGPGTGAIVINPVHLDWDVSGDGVVVDTLVQQIVYSSLNTWQYIRTTS